MSKIILTENDIRKIVSESIDLILLYEICKRYKKHNINENSYAENLESEYYYDADWNEVASLQDKLYAIAYNLTKNMDMAKDLTQSTITRAFEKSSLFQDGTNLLGWLRTIMTNLFKREMDNPRKKKMKYVDDYSSYDNTDDDEVSIQSDDKINDITKRMTASIEELASNKGELYKTIFDLKIKGKRVKEIADELNMNFDTVKYYLRVIRAYLRKSGFDNEIKKILEF